MTTVTYRPTTLEELLARPCGCGAVAWYTTPLGRISCAECGAWLSRPTGKPAPAPAPVAA